MRYVSGDMVATLRIRDIQKELMRAAAWRSRGSCSHQSLPTCRLPHVWADLVVGRTDVHRRDMARYQGKIRSSDPSIWDKDSSKHLVVGTSEPWMF